MNAPDPSSPRPPFPDPEKTIDPTQFFGESASTGPDMPVALPVVRGWPAEEIDKFRSLVEAIQERGFEGFVGRTIWPDGDSPADVWHEFPGGTTHLGAVMASASPDLPPGWPLDLLRELAAAIDDLHRAGGRLNTLSEEWVLLETGTFAFAGLCPVPTLTTLGAGRAELVARNTYGRFAAPEVTKPAEGSPGPASDLFALALMADWLLSPMGGSAGASIMATREDFIGPSARMAFEDTLIRDPANRPSRAGEFARVLREGVVRDAARDGFSFLGSAWSDIGLGGRPNNEDSCGCWSRLEKGATGPVSLGAFVVADGMGGAAHGERASSRAVDLFLGEASNGLPTLGPALLRPSGLGKSAHSWMLRINEAILKLSDCLGVPGSVGTTLTGLLFAGPIALLVHLGDSRAYVLRDGRLVQLTNDQTYAQELFRRGRITEEQAGSSPYRNVLTSHLGSYQCMPQIQSLQPEPGDRYLLCSDGLIEGLDTEEIGELLASAPVQEIAKVLVERSKTNQYARTPTDARPNSDNMTAVVVELHESSTSAMF